MKKKSKNESSSETANKSYIQSEHVKIIIHFSFSALLKTHLLDQR